MTVIAFLVVVFLWAAFGIGLVISQSSLHDSWRWFQGRSIALQVPLGIVFLPWVIAMWIWETSWPATLRGLVVAGLAWASLYAFFPWKAQ